MNLEPFAINYAVGKVPEPEQEDDFEQLLENQIKINEELRSHIDTLNEVLQGQFCIPDSKPTACDKCNFRLFYMTTNGHVHIEQKESEDEV